jgi:hypothetical protein
MAAAESYSGQERRTRDRIAGIQLRRRQKRLAAEAEERRKAAHNGFDIAAALELHLDEITTRRGMIGLLESWLHEARQSDATERNDNYVRALEDAIKVMTTAPDPISAIAVLQRASG